MKASTTFKTTQAKTSDQTKIINRLRRLEGQVRGLQKMVEGERECREILTQLAGARSALDAVGEMIVATYLEDCQGRFGEEQVSILEVLRLLRR